MNMSNCTWRHVKSHTGHPWNEAADAVSWAAVAGWIPTQSLHDRLPDLMLTSQFPDDHQWLWLLEDALHGRAGTPLLDSRGFHFWLDAPFDCEPSPQQRPLILRQQCDAPQRPRVRSTFDLQCATANVLTLQSKGLGARAEHLAAQFTNAGLHCTGLQETRSYVTGHTFLEDFHVLSAPAARGVGGVQFWIAKRWNSDQGTIVINTSHLHILSATSQRLIVRLDHPSLRLIFLIGHAPADGDLEKYDQYWTMMIASIPRAYRSWKHLVLADANARLGSELPQQVGNYDVEQENPTGEMFHQWLITHDLVAPQTFAAHHRGSSHIPQLTQQVSTMPVLTISLLAGPCIMKRSPLGSLTSTFRCPEMTTNVFVLQSQCMSCFHALLKSGVDNLDRLARIPTAGSMGH